MDAILYTSNTGSTQRYAALLSQATGCGRRTWRRC